jgi:hypothetical protein
MHQSRLARVCDNSLGGLINIRRPFTVLDNVAVTESCWILRMCNSATQDVMALTTDATELALGRVALPARREMQV